MLRFPLTIIALIWMLHPACGQNPGRVWVFGQGIGIDFNHDPPRAISVPWQPSLSANTGFRDLNSSAVLYDAAGQIEMYFLNGRYYDKDTNELHHAPQYLFGQYGDDNQFIRLSADTILHIFSADTLIPGYTLSRWVGTYKLYLQKIIRGANGWQFSLIDSLPKQHSLSQSEIIHHQGSQETLVFVHRQAGTNNFFGTWFSEVYVPGLQGFKGQLTSNSASDTIIERILYVSGNNGHGHGHGVLYQSFQDKFTLYDLDPAGNHNTKLLKEYKYLPYNSRRFLLEDHFRLVSPVDFNYASYDEIPFIYNSSYDATGRYLYVFSDINTITSSPFYGSRRLIRYDTYASDSVSFQQSAVNIPLPNPYWEGFIYDMKPGPDGALYIMYGKSIINDASNRYVGRIARASATDPAQLQVNWRYFQFADWSVYRSFPPPSGALAMDPFRLSHNCQDSVQFILNYEAVADSVHWDFGAPALGAANHSAVMNPVVRYPRHGRYPVSVELWWDDQLVRTLYDTIDVAPVPEVSLPADTILCQGEVLELEAGQGFPASYQWSNGVQDSTLSISEAGVYGIAVSTSCGTARDSIRVAYRDFPQTVLRDTTICQGQSVNFSAFYLEDAQYRWQHGAEGRQINVSDSGIYEVTISNYCDTIRDRARLKVEECGCAIHLANAFSPNGDGLNERFAVKYDCAVLEYELRIFNRWGTLVYRHNQDQPAWDGTFKGELAPSGVYVYILQYEGASQNERIQGEKKGSIQLIR